MTYKNGTIYKIICKVDDTICYIGSTFTEVRNRWQVHKRNYSSYLTNRERSCLSIYPYFEKYGIENFIAIKIKSYLVYAENNKDHSHLSIYEQIWINKTKNSVNIKHAFLPSCVKKNIASIFRKKYYSENREQILIQKKEYESINKDKIQKYRDDNREILRQKDKERYWNNHSGTLERKRKNYVNTKEKRNATRREKITCNICNKSFNRSSKASHERSKRHQELVNK
jgi:hypothetical protein